MTDVLAKPKAEKTVDVVRGQLHKFMLLPPMPGGRGNAF